LELGLPDPENDYSCVIESKEYTFTLAWPNHKIGIRQGNNEIQLLGEWHVLECYNLETARLALRKVGELLNVESNVLRIDFTKVQALFDAGQYEAAKKEVEQNLDKLQPDHPDYGSCNKWLKDIRKAIKKNAPEIVKPIETPKSSFPAQVKKDGERLQSIINQPFNILGVYSPKSENYESVDAVWLGIIRNGAIETFAACVENSPAYEDDPNWQVFGSELELLETLIQKLNGEVTFVWGAEKILSLLNQWHYRLKGQVFDSVKFYDLKKFQVCFSR
jgi:tetratricopeptide (TPR) repeat protein